MDLKYNFPREWTFPDNYVTPLYFSYKNKEGVTTDPIFLRQKEYLPFDEGSVKAFELHVGEITQVANPEESFLPVCYSRNYSGQTRSMLYLLDSNILETLACNDFFVNIICYKTSPDEPKYEQDNDPDNDNMAYYDVIRFKAEPNDQEGEFPWKLSFYDSNVPEYNLSKIEASITSPDTFSRPFSKAGYLSALDGVKFIVKITIGEIKLCLSNVEANFYYKSPIQEDSRYNYHSSYRKWSLGYYITSAFVATQSSGAYSNVKQICDNQSMLNDLNRMFLDARTNSRHCFVPLSNLPAGRGGLYGGGDINNRLLVFIACRSYLAWQILYALCDSLRLSTFEGINDGTERTVIHAESRIDGESLFLNEISKGLKFNKDSASGNLENCNIRMYAKTEDGSDSKWITVHDSDGNYSVSCPKNENGSDFPGLDAANFIIDIGSSAQAWMNTLMIGDSISDYYGIFYCDDASIIYAHSNHTLLPVKAPVRLTFNVTKSESFNATNTHAPFTFGSLARDMVISLKAGDYIKFTVVARTYNEDIKMVVIDSEGVQIASAGLPYWLSSFYTYATIKTSGDHKIIVYSTTGSARNFTIKVSN